MIQELTEWQNQELVSGGDTMLHYHLQDRTTNAGLQGDANRTTITAPTYTVRAEDDFLLADTSAASITFTLPRSNNGKEYEFIKLSAANGMFIAPAAGETVLGSLTGVSLYNRFDALRLKAITGGWVAI